MTGTTGYTDTFGRTVSNGLGAATSGQTYVINGTASDFAVAPNIGSITASTSASDRTGVVNLLTTDVDITGQVAVSALPGTNTISVGFAMKYIDASNFYSARLVVTTAGAASLQIAKKVAGVITSLASVTLTGVTIVAGTFYNVRVNATWSQTLQTNVLQAKFWTTTATEPGGWIAVVQDAALVNGTSQGLFARNDATVTGSVARFQNVSSRSYHLPYPATTDQMCFDPAVTYPRQTVVQSLAAAMDAAAATANADATRAGLMPRVRISISNYVQSAANNGVVIPFTTLEFNTGTLTDLSLDPTKINLPSGVWVVTGEIRTAEQASDNAFFQVTSVANARIRSNPAQSNDQGVGGTGHVAGIMDVGTGSVSGYSMSAFWASGVAYTIVYAALTAIKISDDFT